MNKKILFVLVGVSFLYSCDDRFDSIYSSNEAPVAFINDAGTEVFQDSVKTSIKSASPNSIFRIGATDKESVVGSASFSFQSGSGAIFQNNQQADNSISLIGDKAGEVMFKPIAPGIVTLIFKATDSFGKSGEAKVEILVFDNLPPVASFLLTKLAVNDEHEYQFDASKSFDQDRFQGGRITAYEYTINNGTPFMTNQSIFRKSFPKAGSYEIKLVALDNDGGKSSTVTVVQIVD